MRERKSGEGERGGKYHMENTPLDTALEQLIQQTGLPEDAYENHRFMLNLKIPDKLNSSTASGFNLLLNELYEATVGGRNKTAATELKRHCILVLLNLADCALYHKWLVVHYRKETIHGESKGKENTPATFFYKRSNISHRPLTVVVDYLVEHGLVIKHKGAQFKNKPMATRLFPKPELRKQLIKIALEVEEEFTPPYARINKPGRTTGILKAQPSMEKINAYLKDHRWACKAPVTRVYKDTTLKSGRLFTRFQNLPANRIPLRINTLIDDKPIAEVDFNASHLRISVGMFAEEDAGDTPYEDIVEIANDSRVDRNTVKSFINRALSCNEQLQCFNSLKVESFNRELFDIVEAAALKRYPKLPLYQDYGIYMHNREGNILTDVMLAGIKEDIVVLPIHDAVAVQQEHADWAHETMKECWCRNMLGDDGKRLKGVLPRLKINVP